MSHHPNVISPSGTPTTDRTVGELVAEAPGLSRVFQRYQLDFCCQGGKTLRKACEKKGLDLEENLHRHIHLENSVLFPAAEQMAAAVS